jgi:integrase
MKKANKYPGVSRQIDRHGKARYRYRDKFGNDAQLGTDYGSPEFEERYKAAVSGQKSRAVKECASSRTLNSLIIRYYGTAGFIGLEPSTKQVYRNILERLREKYGGFGIKSLQRRHIKKILEDKAATPVAANKLRHRLIVLLDLAIEMEWIENNPAQVVKPMKVKTTGFHTWTEGEIEKYLAFHERGTMPHTAMMLMLYTGAARVDVVKLGWSNVSDGRLEYVRQKTRSSNGMAISMPIHPSLAAVLKGIPAKQKTFLQTKDGQQRSEKGLGKDIRKWCINAGLPGCTSHGLRKAIARRLAEAGASPHQIMAVTGHKTLSEVQKYTEAANRSKMADTAMLKMTRKKKDV